MSQNREGWLNPKKLPPGHMIFHEDGKEGVVISEGRAYGRNGKPLPLDIPWMKKNGYCTNSAVIAALRVPEPEKKTQECPACRSLIPVGIKFCHECGQQLRQLYVPGDEDPEGERIRKLIDPDRPLDSLDALLNPLDQAALAMNRKSVEEMAHVSREELQQELGSVGTGSLVGVPGEPPRPTNPRLGRKRLGIVTHDIPTATNAPVSRG